MAAVATLAAGQAHAQLYWDTNGATPGASATTAAAGTWDLSSSLWTTDSTGSIAATTWTGPNTAVFSAGTNATGTYTVTVKAGTTIPNITGIKEEEGTVTLAAGDATSTLQLTGASPTIANANGMTINAILNSSTGFTKTSAGALTLGAANSITGTINWNQGNVTVNDGGAFGPGGTGNQLIFAQSASAAVMTLKSGITVPEPVTLTGGGTQVTGGQMVLNSGAATWSGDVNLNGATSTYVTSTAGIGVAAGATLTISGNIHNGTTTPGAGPWFVKNGAGNLVLSGTANDFAGSIRIGNGGLIIGASGPIGIASDPTQIALFNGILLENQGTGANPFVAFQGSILSAGNFGQANYKLLETSAPVGLGGLLANGGAPIDNLSGANTFAGDISLGGTGSGGPAGFVGVNAGIAVSAGSLELSGKLYGNSSALRNVPKVGPGELIITGNNDGTSNGSMETAVGGQFNVLAGTLTIAGLNGQMQGGPNSVGDPAPFNVIVAPGARFQLDNSRGVNVNRLLNNAVITIAGGEFQLNGNATNVTNQTSYQLALSSTSLITVTSPGAMTTLDVGNIGNQRSGGGTVILRGISGPSGTAQILASDNLVGTPVAGDNATLGIIPYAIGDASATGMGTDFVTIQSGVTRPLSVAAGEYAPLTNSPNIQNVLVSGAAVTAPMTTVNSIKLDGASPSISIPDGVTLTVNSGALLNAANVSGTISGLGSGTLALSSEGVITVGSAGSLTISAPISGGQGLTKAGLGSLVLTGNNPFSGTDTVDAGFLSVSVDAALGTGNAISLNGGSLQLLSSDIFGTNRTITVNSPIANIIDVSGAATTATYAGQITGANTLTKTGAGNLVLTNSGNNFAGKLLINGGTVTVGNDTSSGGSSVVFGGGTYAVTQSFSTGHSWNISAATATVNVPSGVTLTFGTGTTSPNSISGSGNLFVTGGGTLVLGNQSTSNTYIGDTIIDGSTVDYVAGATALTGVAATPTVLDQTYWTVQNGGTLEYAITSAGTNKFEGITFANLVGNVDVTSGNSVTNLGGVFGVAGATFNKTDAGILILGATGSFAGITQITAGTLQLTIAGALQKSTLNYDNQGGVINFGALTAATLGGLSGGENLALANNAAAALALTVGGTNGSTIYSGSLGGAGSLIKAGTGSLTLTGASTYQGNTTVAPGTLAMGVAGALPSTTNINVTGGTLGVGTFNQTVGTTTLTSGAITGTTGILTSTSYSVLAGSASAILDGGGVAKTGTGAVTFSGTNTYIGGTTISAGTLSISKDANLGAAGTGVTLAGGTLTATGAVTGKRSITVSGNATINAGAAVSEGAATGAATLTKSGTSSLTVTSFNLGGLNVSAGKVAIAQSGSSVGVVGTTGGLTIATTSQLDLNDNDLIVNYSGTSNLTAIRALLATGFNAGNWNGNGIASSQANPNNLTGRGSADSAQWGAITTFGGVGFTSATIVQFTYYGDNNLDGLVTTADFSLFIDGLANGGSTWYQGDYTYDNKVDLGNDFNLFLAGYLHNGGALGALAPIIADSDLSAVQKATLLAAVPEPSTLSLFGLAACGLAARRRRRGM